MWSYPAEQRQRLESLVTRFDQGLAANELVVGRSVQALTWGRDPDAEKLLAEWACGMGGAPMTVAAMSALKAKEGIAVHPFLR